jgi:hypothetical protein
MYTLKHCKELKLGSLAVIVVAEVVVVVVVVVVVEVVLCCVEEMLLAVAVAVAGLRKQKSLVSFVRSSHRRADCRKWFLDK